jgi:hypothetical protein
MKPKVSKKHVKRGLRVLALMLGAGLSFMGVGNLPMFSMDAAESVAFGALGCLVGLITGVSLTYAAKGEVPDVDFDGLINQQIDSVQSKTKKEDK